FRTEDGIELLIHFGLETVALKGECFKAHVKAGDKVKAGQLIAEADMAYLKKREINPVTPILVCGGNDGMELQGHMGQVVHGKNAVITLKKSQEKEAVKEVKKAEVKETKTEEPKKKGFINFDVLQKLGKTLMVVIAVMPAAGLMISLGKIGRASCREGGWRESVVRVRE